MKKISLLLALFVSGCYGYSSRNNELIGQVKKTNLNTPLLCNDFKDVDISLGVVRGGTGSMSSEDQWFYVEDPAVFEVLKKANEDGEIVKITYDVARFRWCVEPHIATKAEVVK